MALSARIRELRIAHGWSQSDLAGHVGASQSAVAHWESGERVPSHATLVALAKVFRVSLDYLVGRTDTPSIVRESTATSGYAPPVVEYLNRAKRDPIRKEQLESIIRALIAAEEADRRERGGQP